MARQEQNHGNKGMASLFDLWPFADDLKEHLISLPSQDPLYTVKSTDQNFGSVGSVQPRRTLHIP